MIKSLILLMTMMFCIGYFIGERNQEHARNLLESNLLFKWISIERKLMITTINEHMIICIDNDCRSAKQWVE